MRSDDDSEHETGQTDDVSEVGASEEIEDDAAGALEEEPDPGVAEASSANVRRLDETLRNAGSDGPNETA